MGAGHGLVGVGAPRDRLLADLRQAHARGLVEPLHELGQRLDGHHRVGRRRERLHRLRCPRRRPRRAPRPSGTSQSLAESTRKCRPTRLTYSPANSSPMISTRLGEHLVPHVRGRPPLADHVLVEVLPRTQPEGEPAVAREQRDRGGLLGDDRRVVAHDRAGHVRHQRHPLGRGGDRAQHGPRVRGVALAVEPGQVVVADDLEVEPGVLGGDGVGDQLAGPALLASSGCSRRQPWRSATPACSPYTGIARSGPVILV